MDIEILHIEGCPNWRDTADQVTAIIAELGATQPPVRVTMHSSPDAAALVPFARSAHHPCRRSRCSPLRRTSDLAYRVHLIGGRFAGFPSTGDLRAVISSALERARDCGTFDHLSHA